MAGGYEFIPPNSPRLPEAKIAPELGRAFERLAYDVGFMAPEENAWLRENRGRKPGSWMVAAEHASVKILTVAGLKLGFVLFPAINHNLVVPANAYSEVLSQAAALKGQVDIVIGMSVWGSFAENKLLETPGQSFDILMGSGPGSAINYADVAGGRTVWLRPYLEGKGVVELEVLDRPANHWIKDKNYSSRIVRLDDNYPAKPEFQAIFK